MGFVLRYLWQAKTFPSIDAQRVRKDNLAMDPVDDKRVA